MNVAKSPLYGRLVVSSKTLRPSFIKQRLHCEQFAITPREPLIPTPLPSHPWEKVSTDLFEFDKTSYMIVVDYFSCFLKLLNSHIFKILYHKQQIF